MKPIFPDCMVFYSPTSCLFYDSQHSLHQIDTYSNETSGMVSAEQVAQLQLQLDDSQLEQKAFALIVVPDAWLSISEHTLDHAVPKQLAPLAALAFAVETAFSSPDTLWFRYQLFYDHKISKMRVMACTHSLAKQVCKPFHDRGMRCCLVSCQQWQAYQNKKFAVWRLAQQGLRPFDPELSRRRHHRTMWASFIVACMLLQTGLVMHDYRLHQELGALDEQLKMVQSRRQQAVSLPDNHPFLVHVLSKVRSLPTSVRLSSFSSNVNTADLVLSMPNAQLQPLLARWQDEEPRWRLKINKKAQDQNAMDSRKEVMDVAVSISTI